MAKREVYVAQMQKWVGAKRGDSVHNEILDLYNSQNPLPRGYKMTVTDPWCATTVSAAAIACGYTDVIPTECSCGKMITKMQKMGIWEENDAYVPKPGDIIFYAWSDTGKGDNTTGHDHVGVIEAVSESQKTMTVIEGNYSNAVKRRVVQVNGRYIRGFGVPKFEDDIPKCFEEYYVVKKGDSLYKIAKAYGISLAKIKNLNPQVKAPLYIIKVGQEIRVR